MKTAVLLGALCAPGGALAYTTVLDDAQVRQAVEAGRSQANTRGQGYQVKEYVLWDREEPLHIAPGTPPIDAVIVATPRERLLYTSYLMAFQGKDWPEDEARALADEAANTLGFRVFAHAASGGPEDRDFLDRFGKATLEIDGGPKLTSAVDEKSSPATDFFITEDGRHVFRWLGTVTYRFDLSGLADEPGAITGTLSFPGPQGEKRSYDLDLSRFR